jgi:hypothetical protein
MEANAEGTHPERDWVVAQGGNKVESNKPKSQSLFYHLAMWLWSGYDLVYLLIKWEKWKDLLHKVSEKAELM